MYKALKIKNFQSHENSSFEFSPFVNVILGLSTVGKTAVLRSLRLLSDNRPLGGRFFSDFAGDKGETTIELQLDNGRVGISKTINITGKEREKKVKSTDYLVAGTDGKEYNFSGTGDSVPDQVKSILNLSELNLQRQFDLPFLVSSSAGEIAKTINRITNQEKADELVASLSSKINDGNRRITFLEQDISNDKELLLSYEGLDDAKKHIEDLSQKEALLIKIRAQISSLEKMILSFREKQTIIKTLTLSIKASKYIDRADKIQTEAIAKGKDVSALSFVLQTYKLRSQEVKNLHEKLEATKNEYLSLFKTLGVCPTCMTKLSGKEILKIEEAL